LFLQCSRISEKPLALVITGGHAFDTNDFYDMFSAFEGMMTDTISQPRANALLETDEIRKYDVLIFYDMWQDITESQKTGFLDLLKEGKGMVFLHHALVSYQEWDEFKNITGGRYHLENNMKDSSGQSGYQHDLDLRVKVLDPDHPVTKNMQDFQIHDEGYFNIEIIPSATPLLEVNHTSCAKYVAWTIEYENSRNVYILLGHDKHAYQNESFRSLVENAVKWTLKSLES
jgi:type 1 glutamine amidotransferase